MNKNHNELCSKVIKSAWLDKRATHKYSPAGHVAETEHSSRDTISEKRILVERINFYQFHPKNESHSLYRGSGCDRTRVRLTSGVRTTSLSHRNLLYEQQQKTVVARLTLSPAQRACPQNWGSNSPCTSPCRIRADSRSARPACAATAAKSTTTQLSARHICTAVLPGAERGLKYPFIDGLPF